MHHIVGPKQGKSIKKPVIIKKNPAIEIFQGILD